MTPIMDESLAGTFVFLRAMQDSLSDLGAVWNHFSQAGARPGRPFLVLSGRPYKRFEQDLEGVVTLGLPVELADGRKFELSVELAWDMSGWIISTDVFLEDDERGQVPFSRSAIQKTINQAEALELVRTAINNLRSALDPATFSSQL